VPLEAAPSVVFGGRGDFNVRTLRMKSLFAGLAVITLATLTGCSQCTPGGPGTTNKSPSYGQSDDTFNLSVPVMSSNLRQGEQKEVTVGIKRAENFDEDVALKFADVPNGVTVEPASPVIKHGDRDAKITFKAGKDASLGNVKVKVTGHRNPSRAGVKNWSSRSGRFRPHRGNE
jgi:hypothetical protein